MGQCDTTSSYRKDTVSCNEIDFFNKKYSVFYESYDMKS